jgi:uncharacterized protein YajQ (UPF0234 family)
MPKESSFDIVSQVDLQQIDDAVNVSMKEITNRFDLKNTGCKIEFNRGEQFITFLSPTDFQLTQIKDILSQKLVKRDISSKALSVKKTEKASGDMIREVNEIVTGIDKEKAKQLVKIIKDSKIKVQASIQEEQVRVSGKNRDDLQAVIALLKEKEKDIPLQFVNYR